LGLLGLVAASCETLNIGGPPPVRFFISGVDVSDTTPTAGDDVTATIHFSGASGPFNFTVTFPADCVTPAVQTVSAPQGATSATLTFTLNAFTIVDDANGRDCAFSVSGTDANGTPGGPVSGTFHVDPIPNLPPTISTVFNAADCSVTATVSDPEGDDPISVSVTGAGTGVSTPAAQDVTGGSGTATFSFSPTSIVAGADTDVTFTANDNHGGTATSTVHVSCPGFVPAPDTLYAIPLSSTVAVGAPVTVLVYTGDPANPFLYMNGVRVIAANTSGFTYVDNSFNVGVAGGAAGDVDGIWSQLPVAPNGFLLPPDNFIQETDTNGQTAIDFNVTPTYSGTPDATYDLVNGSGALFNFQATFSTPGTYQLGFMQHDVVDNTYYQDHNLLPNYFWGDITNVHPGFTTTITVQ